MGGAPSLEQLLSDPGVVAVRVQTLRNLSTPAPLQLACMLIVPGAGVHAWEGAETVLCCSCVRRA